MSIKSVKLRKQLLPSANPYWENLGHGKTLGYRVHKNGTAVWVVKYQLNNARKIETLGDLSHVPESEQFHTAVKMAHTWFLRMGSRTGGIEVGSMCKLHAERLGDKNNLSRYKQLIESDPIASIKLNVLTDADCESWKERHETGKATSSRNRQRTFLRAALNGAVAKKLISNNDSWRLALKASPRPGDENYSRQLCYDREQCSGLVGACESEDFRTLCRVLCIMPLRVGVLSYAEVRDYNATLHTFYVRRDKEHAGRTIPVPQGLQKLFKQQQVGKQSTDLLFTNNGVRWHRDNWRRPIKSAAKIAGLSDETVMFTLRHSVITELCLSGLDLMTIAKLAGTSLEMIEKHYSHLRNDKASSMMDSIMI